MDIEKWIDCVKKDRDIHSKRLDNMSQSDVMQIRNELAENGIEMTPNEINGCLELLKEILSDEQ